MAEIRAEQVNSAPEWEDDARSSIVYYDRRNMFYLVGQNDAPSQAVEGFHFRHRSYVPRRGWRRMSSAEHPWTEEDGCWVQKGLRDW